MNFDICFTQLLRGQLVILSTVYADCEVEFILQNTRTTVYFIHGQVINKKYRKQYNRTNLVYLLFKLLVMKMSFMSERND